jgi:hypothetical protein
LLLFGAIGKVNENPETILCCTEKMQTESITSISQLFLYSNFAQYLGVQRLGVQRLGGFAALRELFSADSSFIC